MTSVPAASLAARPTCMAFRRLEMTNIAVLITVTAIASSPQVRFGPNPNPAQPAWRQQYRFRSPAIGYGAVSAKLGPRLSVRRVASVSAQPRFLLRLQPHRRRPRSGCNAPLNSLDSHERVSERRSSGCSAFLHHFFGEVIEVVMLCCRMLHCRCNAMHTCMFASQTRLGS